MISSIVWFRNDLRIEDNPALEAAAKRGAVIPLFIWAPEEENPWAPGEASRFWLHQSLESLSRDFEKIGGRLILRKGKSFSVLSALIRETGATAVYWNRRYEPAVIERDSVIKEELKKQKIETESFNGSLLFEPWKIRNKQGLPYKVYTAFWNYCLNLDPLADFPSKGTPILTAPSKFTRAESLSVKDLALEPKIKWAEGIRASWKPGSRGAKAELKRFCAQPIFDYQKNRDIPDIVGTSRLSPYLHFGEISPKRIWFEIKKNSKTIPYLRQIIWREFSYYLLYHFPKTPLGNLRSEFDQFPWDRNAKNLKCWEQGKTGYPIVDAGMRELWHTGWMHNRVRMIAASFLIKHLLIDWREGAKWFWDTLIDADLANNTMGWQWVAGSGADAAPYFRIFNPILQGEKFDPHGKYIRRWIPELAHLPDKFIHKPWLVPSSKYPKPIVDHDFARRRALISYQKIA